MKTVMTISGTRPDFIRFSQIFRKLDESPDINHILVHTGQHYDVMLSDVFFDELEIRKPDYNLGCGAPGKEHFQLSSDITVAIIKLIREKNLSPDLILFLGDTNSVVCSVGLKKEGYRLGHIEAGMRSYDRQMLEEINRVVCDHCCDVHFVYHENYRQHLLDENIPEEGIHVVGNTIVEVCRPFADELLKKKKQGNFILMDIHRPENFKDRDRLAAIFTYANSCSRHYRVPVYMVSFGRTMEKIREFNLTPFNNGNYSIGPIIIPVNLMSYKVFLYVQYHSLFVISDSGTAQEEAPLLDTPVIVPRDYTERPESMAARCSFLLVGIKEGGYVWKASYRWLDDVIHNSTQRDVSWLGDGRTAERIVKIIEEE